MGSSEQKLLLALFNDFCLLYRLMQGWIDGMDECNFGCVEWRMNGMMVDGCFTSFVATCGGRGWCRRHALPPAPTIKLGQDESDVEGGDDSECFSGNRTEEI